MGIKISNLKIAKKPDRENLITEEVLGELKKKFGFNSVLVIGVGDNKVHCGSEIEGKEGKHLILHAIDILLDNI